MADDFEIFEDGRGSVLVMLHPDAAISREEIIKLLVQAGVDPDAIAFVEPNDVDEADAEGRCVVIPIDRNVADAPELVEAARGCAQSASGVVVVFGAGFEHPGLHPIAAGYGTQCGWSPTELQPCLKQDEGSGLAPTDSGGDAVDRPRPSQVNCR